LAATCDQFNLNPAVITLILGVDQLMDMARASVNVLGNCLASIVVSKWEGAFRKEDWGREISIHQQTFKI
jgi:proton glutamate symport protein